MDRNEFVSTLRAVLTGEVPAQVVEENVRYYNSYISQEIASGKTEEEVLEGLGDPRLIARTIIDTQAQKGAWTQGYGSREAYDSYESYASPGDSEEKKGFHAEFRDDGGVDIKYNRFNFNTWYGKLLLIVAAVLVLALIFLIIGGILAWVIPVLIPVLLLVWLLRIIFGGR